MKYILTLDPSSHNLGMCIGDESGQVIETFTAKSEQTSLCKRLMELQDKAAGFIVKYEDEISTIVYENNTFSPPPLYYSVAVVAVMLPNAEMSNRTGVHNSTWKSYWRKTTGLDKKSPKGRADLKVLLPNLKVDSDDAADAVMIYKCFISTYKGDK